MQGKLSIHLFLLLSLCAEAVPVFDSFFQDNMVLQRDETITIWGTAKPESSVSINWQGEEKVVTSNSEGEWTVSFPPLAAKASASALTASDDEGSVTLKNIRIGDVWLASGQSNMEFSMIRFTDGQKDYTSFNIIELRFIKIHNSLPTGAMSYSPEGYKKARERGFFSYTWQNCTPENTRHFSATAAYFGRALQAELGIPLGIICNAVGGVGMESWLPKKLIEEHPHLRPLRGDQWMSAPVKEFSSWMAGRGKQNLKHLLAAGEKNLQHPFRPSCLYEHALRPLLRLPIRGVIWYQGNRQTAQGFSYTTAKTTVPVTAKLNGESISIDLPHTTQAGDEIRYNYSTYMEPNIVSEQGKLPLFPFRIKK